MLDRAELRERIASFPRWHYEFDLDGELTPIAPDIKNRHSQRKRYLFDPLVKLCGGSLKGKRVLDLGCNAGFWSLACIESGCDYVLGVDGRRMHIEQAELVFQVKSIDKSRYTFVCENVYDFLRASPGKFDIVLCLGLLYHVNKHMELFELCSSVNSDLLVVDTKLAPHDDSRLELVRESMEDPRNAWENELVMLASAPAIMDMVEACGYRVVVLEPSFSDYSGAKAYELGRRRAFFCAKKTELKGLAVEKDPRGSPLTDFRRCLKIPPATLTRALGYKLARREATTSDILDFPARVLLPLVAAKIKRRLGQISNRVREHFCF